MKKIRIALKTDSSAMRIGTRASVAHSMVPRSSGRRRTLGPTNSHNESAPPCVEHSRACRHHTRQGTRDRARQSDQKGHSALNAAKCPSATHSCGQHGRRIDINGDLRVWSLWSQISVTKHIHKIFEQILSTWLPPSFLPPHLPSAIQERIVQR